MYFKFVNFYNNYLKVTLRMICNYTINIIIIATKIIYI